uniref:Receptor-interacting serine/threonine-protein kinase 1 n=1 Tax=Anolis carolinensis TaxID=28377 RepID=H9GPJ2_ANOCA|nr:PREDICTED: receptor-interacting serine/threonine-protein kinase 1 isoform X1 [Anolis carolinensis]|eukprot:XP_003224434.1 PREDICTED: receptor-interacting serine/threonine-protein kinase 1 isoform X1 [Anolis carolinensis]
MSLVDIQMSSADLLHKEQLDAGGFGMISLCSHKSYGLVILKTVYTGPQRKECNNSLLEEGKIMHKLHHDRVVKLLGVILEDGNYSLVMEYLPRGNLMSVLKATSIPLPLKGRFIFEIIEGMVYLTEQGLVHKDLKPENILVDEDFHIKIADLGVACFKNWSRLTKEETSRQRKIKCSSQSNAGTLFYMAPEHLEHINTVPVEKSDVYSFGIVIWAIFACKEPYENAVNDMQVCFCIINGERPLMEEVENKCPREIITLMKQSWSQKPEERLTFAEINIIYKPFYQENYEKYVEDDVKKIKEVYPEPIEVVKRMQSLQVDAVAEPPSNSSQTDLPSSLHSSQQLGNNTVDDTQFSACPENEPVESCENASDPFVTLERKLQDELNYHTRGSRMDRPENYSATHSAAAWNEKRKMKVSNDPFTKGPAAPRAQEANSGSSISPSNAFGGPYTSPWPWPLSPAGPGPENGNATLDRKSPNGARPSNFSSFGAEDMYRSHSTSPFSFYKPPVPESEIDRFPHDVPKSLSTQTGPRESRPVTKKNIPYTATPMDSTGEPPRFNIFNSTGIQIGNYNHLEIKDPSLPSTPPAPLLYNHKVYRDLFESTTLVSETHLNIVRDNMGKHWKDCSRKLGFSDAELDEIDHDYERDGLKEKVYQMFQRWQMRQGSKGATVGKLALALHACHRIDLLNCLVKINKESKMNKK